MSAVGVGGALMVLNIYCLLVCVLRDAEGRPYGRWAVAVLVLSAAATALLA